MTSSRHLDIVGLRAEFAGLSEAVASRFDRLVSNPAGASGETTGRLAAAASEIRSVHAELERYLASPHADPRQEAVVLGNLIAVQRRTLAMLDAYDSGAAPPTAAQRTQTAASAAGAPASGAFATRTASEQRPSSFAAGPMTAPGHPHQRPAQQPAAAPPAALAPRPLAAHTVNQPTEPEDEQYDAFRNQLAHLLTAYEHRQHPGATATQLSPAALQPSGLQAAGLQPARTVTQPPSGRPSPYAEGGANPAGAWPSAPRTPSAPTLPPVASAPHMQPPTMPPSRPAMAPPAPTAAPIMSPPARPAYQAIPAAAPYGASSYPVPPDRAAQSAPYPAHGSAGWQAGPPPAPQYQAAVQPPQAAVALGAANHDEDDETDETTAPPRRWTPMRMALLAGLAVVTLAVGSAAVYVAGPRLHRVTALILGGPPSATKSQQAKSAATKLQDRVPSALATAAATPGVSTAATDGKFIAVLATYQDFSAARQAFVALKQSFPDLLGTTAPDIETVEVNGSGTWHRLGVLPAMPRADAQDLCNRLQAAGHSGCWVKPQG